MKRAKSLKKVHLMGNLFNNETDRGLSSGISNLTYLDLSKYFYFLKLLDAILGVEVLFYL